jgi:hypothetical protein
MKRLSIILIALLVLCGTANAQMLQAVVSAGGAAPATPMKQKLMSGYSAVGSVSAARFLALSGSYTTGNTEALFTQLMPTGGTLRKLYVKISAAPGSGKSYTVMLRRGAGAGAMADTTITCAVSNTATTCSDVAHEVSVSADDKVAFSVTPAGTPDNTVLVSTLIEFQSGTTNESIMFGAVSAASATKVYVAPGVNYSSSTEANATVVMPCAGTITNFYSRMSAAPGAGAGRTISINLNGSPAAGKADLSYGAADVAISAAQNIAVAAGDRLAIVSDVTGTPATATQYFGILFKPTTDGQFPILSTVGGQPVANNVTRYGSVGGSAVIGTSEVNFAVGWDDFNIVGMTGYVTVASGSGKSFTITPRVQTGPGDASNPPEITFSNETGPKSSSGTLTPSQWEGYDVKFANSATGNTTLPSVGFVGVVP